MPGDAVVLTGTFSIAKTGDIGILNGALGVPESALSITFNCESRAHRGDIVSCSGGPGTLYTPVTELIPTGEQIEFTFWRWKDRPRRDGGEPFTLRVPLWAWRGESSHVDPEVERAIIQSVVAKRMPSPNDDDVLSNALTP